MRIEVKGVRIEITGFAGVIVSALDAPTICVDIHRDDCEVEFYTHNHTRHFNPLSHSDLFYAPFGGQLVKEWDSIKLGGSVEVEAVPAYNIGGVHRRGCCLGYIIRHRGAVIYIAGDTDLIEEMKSVPRPTVAVIPIGGGNVMTPEEAAEAVKMLRPIITVPVHYDRIEDLYQFRILSHLYTQVIHRGRP